MLHHSLTSSSRSNTNIFTSNAQTEASPNTHIKQTNTYTHVRTTQTSRAPVIRATGESYSTSGLYLANHVGYVVVVSIVQIQPHYDPALWTQKAVSLRSMSVMMLHHSLVPSSRSTQTFSHQMHQQKQAQTHASNKHVHTCPDDPNFACSCHPCNWRITLYIWPLSG